MRAAATLLLAAGALCPQLPAQSRFDLHQVEWTVHAHAGESLQMEMRLDPLHDRDRLVLRVPWWRPGSYRYATYERSIRDLRAVDEGGVERAITTLDPRTFQVETRGARALTVRYTLDVEDDSERGALPVIHLHGPGAFLYVEDALELPHTLRFDLPEGWEHASGHRPDAHDPTLFRSPNYDVFVDCPIVLGAFERHVFESHGKPIEVVIAGRRFSDAQFPRDEWIRKVEAICHAGYELMGEFPFERFVFLFVFNDFAGGYGLEHLNSTTIMFNHNIVRSGDLEPLESVTAHEFFHLWNVKRIRPRQLGPFEYASDVRTKDLWWLEGVTSYYTDVLLQRSGLRDSQPDWFWSAQTANYQNVTRAPGFGKVSAERASWTVWDPNPGQNISYYDQGQSLGLLLDASIRIETRNRRSLDDVVRFLHRWVDYPGEGYRPGDLERAVFAVTGWDCAEFFDHHVSGLVDYPFVEVLTQAGLSVIDEAAGAPYLGLSLDASLGVRVREGSAAEEAGFRQGDRLLRVNGSSIGSHADLRAVIATLEAGGAVPVEVERDGAVEALSLPIRERTRRLFRIEPDPEASPEAAAIARGILTGTPAGV